MGCQFLSISINYHHAKNHKKLMRHCWEKYWTDGRTENRQTVQKWFYRILRKTGVQKFGSYSKKQ